MTPEVIHSLPLGFQLLLMWAMLSALAGPFLTIYCVWRFFKDLRRIAVALENPPGRPREDGYDAFIAADRKRAEENKAPMLSAFGR